MSICEQMSHFALQQSLAQHYNQLYVNKVENLPCNAWDAGSVPRLVRYQPRAVGQLSLCTATTEAML